MDRFISFGSVYLRQYPSGTNLTFRHKNNVLENQQYLLDNLWNNRNPQDKVRTLNALLFYFS